jgi:hypothetical protein
METRPIMRTRKVIALSLISAGAAVLFSGCPAQPPGPCVVARAAFSPFGPPGTPYATHYYFVAGSQTGDCTTDPTVAAWPPGDFTGGIFAEAYGEVTAIDKVTGLVPEEFGWTSTYGNNNGLADYVECTPTNADLYAAQTPPIGGGADGGPCVDNPIAFGAFTTDTEDSNNTCVIAGSDAGTQVVNGVLVTYNFNKVLVYTNAAAGEGTQIQANVTMTRQSLTPGVAACTRSYVALGLWPATVCNVNNDCNAIPQPGLTPPRPLGSGILTNIPVFCDLTLPGSDPVIVPSASFCGTPTDQSYISLTPGCGGGDKDNNGVDIPGSSGVCFFTNASPTSFPYTD